MKNFACVLSILISSIFSVASQVISPSRKTDWTIAGYHGPIPSYPLVKNITDFGGTGDGSAVNDLALQNAVASLSGQNGIIYFPAGTFIFHSPITLRSGLVLRGAGAGHTVLSFNLGGAGNLISVAGSASSTIAHFVLPVFKDGVSLLVDDASSFQVNDYVKIYQNDTSLVNDSWALESVGQVVHIENIQGNTITFSSALRRNYLIADSPKIRKLVMTTGVGIECLKIKRMDATTAQTANVKFSNAAKCWVKGVESDSCNFAHIQIAGSTNIEITNCYFHGSFGYGSGGQGYGISCEYTSGECLIENNIFKHLRHSMLLQSGANGNVFDYNYSLQPFKSESPPTDLSPDIVMHGNYPYMNLFEGNIVQNIFVDASHGANGPYNTIFRNRAESYGIIISTGAGDSANLVGNEITGAGFGKGNYIMQGAGNLEFGNNKNNTIVPAGTTSLAEKSYIYAAAPLFWNISSPWPPVGIPNTFNTGSNPARERYLQAQDLAVCSSSAMTYTFTGSGNWNVPSNWSGSALPPGVLPAGSEIIINPVAGGQCILNIPYTISEGSKLTVAPGKIFILQGNLGQ